MIGKAIQPAHLDELAGMVGFSVKGANKAAISELLLSTRKSVAQRADSLAAGFPPALLFDPRWQRP
jgi:hypothetical protein